MAITGKIDPNEIGVSATGTGLYINDLKDLSELKFRPVGFIFSGYQYFQKYTKDDGTDGIRPVRSELYPEKLVDPSTQPWDGEDSRPTQFLVMAIYDFADETIKIWQTTKKAVLQGLMSVELDEDLGEIQDYTYKVTKTGVKMDTEYKVIRYDKSELSEDIKKKYEEAKINLADFMKGTGGIGEKKDDSGVIDLDPNNIDF